MTNEEFWKWVDGEMRKRKLSLYRIEKIAGLSNAAISRQARNWSRATVTACTAIAQAFELPVEHVLRLANYLPSTADPSGLDPKQAERIRRLVERLAELPPARQARIMEAVLMLLEVQEAAGETDVLREPAETE